jgi:hypothetical protein
MVVDEWGGGISLKKIGWIFRCKRGMLYSHLASFFYNITFLGSSIQHELDNQEHIYKPKSYPFFATIMFFFM